MLLVFGLLFYYLMQLPHGLNPALSASTALSKYILLCSADRKWHVGTWYTSLLLLPIIEPISVEALPGSVIFGMMSFTTSCSLDTCYTMVAQSAVTSVMREAPPSSFIPIQTIWLCRAYFSLLPLDLLLPYQEAASSHSISF